MSPRKARPVSERFWPKVDRSGNGCWEWTGGKISSGYGTISADGTNKLAHRVAYELLVGPIPDGLHIDHLCRRASCVNPEHLEAVTQRENTLRGNGATARNSRKTHCPADHEYSPENTYLTRGGRRRICRTCTLARMKTERDRKAKR